MTDHDARLQGLTYYVPLTIIMFLAALMAFLCPLLYCIPQGLALSPNKEEAPADGADGDFAVLASEEPCICIVLPSDGKFLEGRCTSLMGPSSALPLPTSYSKRCKA